MKRTIALMLALLMLCLAVTGCSSSQDAAESEADPDAVLAEMDEDIAELVNQLGDTETKFDSPELLQLKSAPKGNPTATIHTTMGDISVVLYPEQAPKAVENFTTLAEQGYYDGVSFHRVINDFMIQGGDPEGTGAGGESIWGESFEDEFSDQLHNFRGALSMANAGTNTNGSQFFIVQRTDKLSDSDFDACVKYMYANSQLSMANNLYLDFAASGASMTKQTELVEALNAKLTEISEGEIPANQLKRFQKAAEAYQELGGTPTLDYSHTVFGFVTEGMDVVDAIAAVETDDNDKPVEEVLITGITLGTVA